MCRMYRVRMGVLFLGVLLVSSFSPAQTATSETLMLDLPRASQHALVKSCTRVQLEVRRERVQWRGPLFNGIDSQVQPRKLCERLVG